MIAELITPLMIATAPIAITTESLQYSHETQSVVQPATQLAQGWGQPIRQPTWNGTRTYAPNGQPSDSDND